MTREQHAWPLTADQQARIVKACREVIDELRGSARRVAVEILAQGKHVHGRQVSRAIGLSHQRIGQVANTIVEQISERVGRTLAEGAAEIDRWAGPICGRNGVSACLRPMFRESGDNDAVGVARWCLRRLTPRRLVEGYSVRRDVPEKTRRLQETAKRLAIDGTVETEQLKREAGLDADDDIELLNKLTGMITKGRWTAIRPGKAGLIRLTLLNAGDPLTAEEISKRSGVSLESTQSTLRNRTWAKRNDSRRWALADWNLREFRGVGRRAVDLLEEAGGRMLHKELKQRLETETRRARAVISTTLTAPRFRRTGKWIELTDPRDPKVRSLRSEAHGIDARGNPYVVWLVPASRDRTRIHITGIGHALAAHAGCDTETTTRLRVVKPEGCDDVSLTRYPHMPGGTTLGRLKTVLERLEAKPNELLRITLEPERQVRIERAEEAPRGGTVDARRRPPRTRRPTRLGEPRSDGAGGATRGAG